MGREKKKRRPGSLLVWLVAHLCDVEGAIYLSIYLSYIRILRYIDRSRGHSPAAFNNYASRSRDVCPGQAMFLELSSTLG